MTMYIIIGGDGKEYGPISEADVRQWIAEGRLNAQSNAKAESDAEFRPLEKFPEFAALLGAAQPPPLPAAPPPPNDRGLVVEDYQLDLGACISNAWNLLTRHFWPVVGTNTLIFVIIVAFNQLVGLIMSPITRPQMEQMRTAHKFSVSYILLTMGVGFIFGPIYTLLTAGLYKFYLKIIRGETARTADALSGFGPQAVQLVLLGWVQGGLIMIGLCLCVIPGIYLAIAWSFAVPLVIDRNLNFWAAMELSRKQVNRHWFLVFATILVVGLLSEAGLLACCIGILVSLPLGMLTLMYAYETIFSGRKD